MALLGELAGTPERETGGRTALARLEYQTCWGACRIVDLYLAGEEFRIGFEFHDDIIEVGGNIGDEWVKFYQVKTRQKGSWTLRDILRRPSGGSSILGKLVAGKIKFKKSCRGTYLVANGEFSFISGERRACRFSDVEEENRKNLIAELKSEIGEGEFFDDCLEDLEFWKTDLPLNHYEEVLIARLIKLVESRSANITYRPPAFMRRFIDECRTRSKRYLSDFSSVSEVSSGKFISRSDVQKWIDDLLESSQHRPSLSSALSAMPAKWNKYLRRYWRDYELRTQDPLNLMMERFRSIVRDQLDTHSPEHPRATFVDMVEDVVTAIVARNATEQFGLEEGMIITAVVYESLASDGSDEGNREIQKADKKLEVEKL